MKLTSEERVRLMVDRTDLTHKQQADCEEDCEEEFYLWWSTLTQEEQEACNADSFNTMMETNND